MSKPTRAFKLTLSLQADTREDLINALIDLARNIERHSVSTGVTGGCSSGVIYELLINPEQTHEKYFEELNRYLEANKLTTGS